MAPLLDIKMAVEAGATPIRLWVMEEYCDRAERTLQLVDQPKLEESDVQNEIKPGALCRHLSCARGTSNDWRQSPATVEVIHTTRPAIAVATSIQFGKMLRSEQVGSNRAILCGSIDLRRSPFLQDLSASA